MCNALKLSHHTRGKSNKHNALRRYNTFNITPSRHGTSFALTQDGRAVQFVTPYGEITYVESRMRCRLFLILVLLALSTVVTAYQITTSGVSARSSLCTVRACQVAAPDFGTSIEDVISAECGKPLTILTGKYLDTLICSSYPATRDAVMDSGEEFSDPAGADLTLPQVDPTQQLAGL